MREHGDDDVVGPVVDDLTHHEDRDGVLVLGGLRLEEGVRLEAGVGVCGEEVLPVLCVGGACQEGSQGQSF